MQLVVNMTRRFKTLGRFAAIVAVPALLLIALSGSAKAERTGTLRFTVTGIEADRGGRILCALYEDPDNWLDDDPYRGTQAFVSDARATCVFADVPEGVYATAALHDEDGDGEMDTILGFPQEGYCMSRNAEDQTMLKPDWDDAVFRFNGGSARVTADIKY